MKKINGKYVSILLIIGLMIGFGVAFALIRAVHTGYWVAGTIFAIMAEMLMFTVVKQIIWSFNVKKLEHTFPEKGFTPEATFESTVGKIYIDGQHGRIGVISKLYPFQFQTVHASQIEHTSVDDGKMLGGTRLIRFCFKVDGVVWKVPTLTVTNKTLSMQHPKVVKALEVASAYCEIISQAKENI